MIEEKIYHDAGATTPQGMRRADLVRLITEAGRIPIERDTMYRSVTRSEDSFHSFRVGAEVLRRGRLADVEAFFRLDLQCFEGPFRFSRKTMAALVHSPASVTLVVEQDEQVQAFLIGQTEKRLARIYLATLDVNPQMRRAGLASQLMDGLEREAYETGDGADLAPCVGTQ